MAHLVFCEGGERVFHCFCETAHLFLRTEGCEKLLRNLHSFRRIHCSHWVLALQGASKLSRIPQPSKSWGRIVMRKCVGVWR